MVSVMLQYMICKGIWYGEQSSSKIKMFIWKSLHHEDTDMNANLLHDNLSCWYVCMNSHEIHKKLFETMYITQIQNKIQNMSKAEMCR